MSAEENDGKEGSESGCLGLLANVALSQEEYEEATEAHMQGMEEGEEAPQGCEDVGRAPQGNG